MALRIYWWRVYKTSVQNCIPNSSLQCTCSYWISEPQLSQADKYLLLLISKLLRQLKFKSCSWILCISWRPESCMRTSNGYGVWCRSVTGKVILSYLDWKPEMSTVPLQALIFVSLQGNMLITQHLFDDDITLGCSSAFLSQTGGFSKLKH